MAYLTLAGEEEQGMKLEATVRYILINRGSTKS